MSKTPRPPPKHRMCSVIFNSFHLLALASNGYGVMLFKWVAEGADALGQLCFFLLLFVLARGWTVTSTILEGRAVVGLMQVSLLLCAAANRHLY